MHVAAVRLISTSLPSVRGHSVSPVGNLAFLMRLRSINSLYTITFTSVLVRVMKGFSGSAFGGWRLYACCTRRVTFATLRGVGDETLRVSNDTRTGLSARFRKKAN